MFSCPVFFVYTYSQNMESHPDMRSVVRQSVFRFAVMKGKLLLSILKYSIESRSFPSSFDMAGHYAKHQMLYFERYCERGSISMELFLILQLPTLVVFKKQSNICRLSPIKMRMLLPPSN